MSKFALVDLLCDYGAEAGGAMRAALAHGEFEAADALIRRGAAIDLPAAAATGRLAEARAAAPNAAPESRHLALAWASQFGHVDIVRMLLDLGEDPNRFNPQGAHSHSTPLHQAAQAGHKDVVEFFVERGSRLDIRDILYQGTPSEWADYAGQTELAAFLRAHAGRRK